MTQIGQTPQFQSTVISNNAPQTASRPAQRDTKEKSSNADVAQAQANTNYTKLAQDIIAARAAGTTEQIQPNIQRGQVVNFLV